VEAFRLDDNVRTRSALFGTFTDEQRPYDTHRYNSEYPEAGIVMPDGVSAFLADSGAVTEWDLATGERGATFPALGPRLSAAALRSSPDGARLSMLGFAADWDEPGTTLGVYDITTRTLQFELVVVDSWVQSVTFSADGSTLYVTLDPDGRTLAIDTSTGATSAALAGQPVNEEFPYGGGVVALADGRVLVGSSIGTVQLVDGVTLAVLDTIDVPPATAVSLRAVGDGISAVGSGPDGVVRIGVDPLRVVWDQVDFSDSCGNLVVVDAAQAVYCGDFYGRLTERDLATGLIRRELDAQNGNTGSLWPARDGTELVSFSANEPVVARWRLNGSGPVTSVVATGSSIRDISPDGDRILVGTASNTSLDEAGADFTWRLIDTATGSTLSDLNGLIAPLFRLDQNIIGALPTDGGVRVGVFDVGFGNLGEGPTMPGLPTYISADPGKENLLGS